MYRRVVLKIVTVNIPESYLDLINKLIGEDGLYPSRSELVRAAVHEWLIKQLKITRNLLKKKVLNTELEDDNFVLIPFESKNENNEKVREVKRIRVLRKLN